MEDTLRVLLKTQRIYHYYCVLILVLMEDTLRDYNNYNNKKNNEKCLNPCFNGRYS